MTMPENFQILQIIKRVCEKYGCEIQEIDFEKQVLNIEGPPDQPGVREKCVEELEQMLEMYNAYQTFG